MFSIYCCSNQFSVTRSLQKNASIEAFYGAAFGIVECSVALEILSPKQIARLCRPNRPQKTRPKVWCIAQSIDIESIDHNGKKTFHFLSKNLYILT